ncbi:hypothetical protein CO683_40170 [Bradyrhizobium ottawaense]|uniref:hypothetical protein n=1 Tax=Bradyrhizobium TaxID=374 RepID=UPI000BE8DC52|nr:MULTISPECIES: hypothetical protein [Bradyrhizobium]MDA9391778.1 hypothetical protein [Bradyrhizobium sp. CCBAU 45394]MDA9537328.1 hypothetical protein [Bradyrhizobium sp. CCBAU 21362]PDT64131.1 hypothetical protein CO683_40170 [Bradyrhizobium ottawaense]
MPILIASKDEKLSRIAEKMIGCQPAMPSVVTAHFNYGIARHLSKNPATVPSGKYEAVPTARWMLSCC